MRGLSWREPTPAAFRIARVALEPLKELPPPEEASSFRPDYNPREAFRNREATDHPSE